WVSVGGLRTEARVCFPFWFLNFLLLAQRPFLIAEGFLLARAAAAICFASSRVLIFRQSWLGGACLPPRAYPKVRRNKVGSRYSAFPPRPCLVILMKPSTSASRIAGATHSRVMP